MTETRSASPATGSSSDPRAMDLQGDPPVYLWTQATPISKPAGDESFLDTLETPVGDFLPTVMNNHLPSHKFFFNTCIFFLCSITFS